MKRPVMRDLYAVAVAFLGPHCVKWWRRYLAQGIAGLESHSRRPKRSPSTKTGTCEVALILELRSQRNLGARRIQSELKRLHSISLAIATIHKVLFLNRPGFPGEYFICELRLPDHYFRWKHNKLFLLLPEGYDPAFPAIVDCYTSPPT